jgi:hypothetical protein
MFAFLGAAWERASSCLLHSIDQRSLTMTTNDIVFLAIAIGGFGSLMLGMLYATFKAPGEKHH